jgi:hypothetical protein
MNIPATCLVAFLVISLSLLSCAARGSHVPYPVTSSFGPFDLKAFEQYDTFALFTFTDAPGAPRSGEEVAGVLTYLLRPMGFTILDQIRLDQAAREHPGLGEVREQTTMRKIAQAAGAQVMIVGEVGQWDKVRQQGPIVWVPTSYGVAKVPRKQWNEVTVALGLKIIDVKTGETLFSGQGTLSEPTRDHPEIGAEQILIDVLARCFHHIAPVRTGVIGYKATMQEVAGQRVPVVTEVLPESPAERAGLHVGDVILACNESPKGSWKTLWQHQNACSAEAGQTKSIHVGRAKQRVTIRATALARSSFFPESLDGHQVKDLFSPL